MPKKQTGLSISRTRYSFTCSWKKGQKYSAQYFQKAINSKDNFTKKWGDNIGKNATSKKIEYTPSDYYPITDKKITAVYFRVKGKKGTKYSTPVSKGMTISPPAKPKVTVAQSSAYSNTFTIDADQHVNDREYWGTYIEYQTALALDKEYEKHDDVDGWTDISDGRVYMWNGITQQDVTNTTYTVTESAENISQIEEIVSNNKSAVRWFRARISGPAGSSDFVPYTISYSAPKSAEVTNATVLDNNRAGVNCTISWKYWNSINYPIDSIKIQYTFSSPMADKTPEDPNPSDAVIGGDNTITPETAPSKETEYNTMVSFDIETQPPSDKFVYVRVNTVHNNIITYGTWFLCQDTSGAIPGADRVLASPTLESVTPGTGNLINVSASNNSNVSGVFMVIKFIGKEGTDSTFDIGIMASTDASKSVEIPLDYVGSYKIGVYAATGSYGTPKRIGGTGQGEGYNIYDKIKTDLKSDMVTLGGDVPAPPENVALDNIGDGNVRVTWDWKWTEADSAEVSWSDYSEALISTEPPNSFEVPNSQTNTLIVKNLELGKTWYFWVRLSKGDTVSIWSDVRAISLSSEPNTPVLTLSKNYVTIDEKFTANWTYVTADNADQASAKLCLCDVDGTDISYGKTIAEIPDSEGNPTKQYVTLDPSDPSLGWSQGSSYNLAVKVTSSSGLESEKWSDYKTVTVIEPTTCYLSSSTFDIGAADYDDTSTYSIGDYVYKTIIDPDDRSTNLKVLYKCISNISSAEEWNEEHWAIDENHPYEELTQLPLKLEISSTGNEIVRTTVVISRSVDYFIDRPDGGLYGGYADEIVYQKELDSVGTLIINQNDDELYGYLDDSAYYYLTITTIDNYGQTSTARYQFRVNWTHQAIMPIANVTIDNEYSVAKITIFKPENSVEGDTCDIYRMSADGIHLIYSGADFSVSGSTYVDPYPTIGEHGGHRIVYRTLNGDYILPDDDEDGDGDFAWVDFNSSNGDIFNSVSNLIDFDEETLEVKYNADIDNSWHKDFQVTKYLGGSTQGDYNVGTNRTGTLSTDIQTTDIETIEKIRYLASYEGLCHIRTKDGSNYVGDVEVNENIPYTPYYDNDGKFSKMASYSFAITKVDSPGLDGMTLEDWEKSITPDE